MPILNRALSSGRRTLAWGLPRVCGWHGACQGAGAGGSTSPTSGWSFVEWDGHGAATSHALVKAKDGWTEEAKVAVTLAFTLTLHSTNSKWAPTLRISQLLLFLFVFYFFAFELSNILSPFVRLIKNTHTHTLNPFLVLHKKHNTNKPGKLVTLVGRRLRLGVSAAWLSVFMLTKEKNKQRGKHWEHKQLIAAGQNCPRHTLRYITSPYSSGLKNHLLVR